LPRSTSPSKGFFPYMHPSAEDYGQILTDSESVLRAFRRNPFDTDIFTGILLAQYIRA
jgi:hypothetical protein